MLSLSFTLGADPRAPSQRSTTFVVRRDSKHHSSLLSVSLGALPLPLEGRADSLLLVAVVVADISLFGALWAGFMVIATALARGKGRSVLLLLPLNRADPSIEQATHLPPPPRKHRRVAASQCFLVSPKTSRSRACSTTALQSLPHLLLPPLPTTALVKSSRR